MSASGTSILGTSSPSTSSDESRGAYGFGPTLEATTYYFSLFLLFFPPVALLLQLRINGALLLSMPLFLMFICGVFGTRASLSLRRNRAQ
jgi:hypothetical protein